MSMVWSENCAFGHLLAASLVATRPAVGGRAFYLADFDEHIAHAYLTPPATHCQRARWKAGGRGVRLIFGAESGAV